MINWKRLSFAQIQKKWDDFIFSRNYPYRGQKQAQEKYHITCLDREALIEDLLQRNESANRVIDSYGKLKQCIEK